MILTLRLRPALALCCLLLAGINSPAQQANDSNPGFKITVSVNKVLIPVVVRDAQGRIVTDLTKEDFQLFDNDKPRPISAFTVERRRVPDSNPGENHAENSPSAQPAPPNARAASHPAQRFIVFLFDDMHLTTEDLAHAQKAAVQALDGALSASGIAAVFSTSGAINSGLTRDRARLEAAIMALHPQNLYRSNPSDCPHIDYYQADLIENKHDGPATAEAINQLFNCNPALDKQRDTFIAQRLADAAARRALTVGRQDVQSTYATIRDLVRRVAALPGQRTLILISPGFLPLDQQSLIAESQIVDFAVRGNVTLSVLDARGLYTTGITASENVSFGSAQSQSDYRASSMALAENTMAALADGTGGTFVRNTNDLDAGFKALTDPPECVYLLELSLDNVKPDGAYHRLKVKLDRPGLHSQSRRGYVAPKADKNKK
jgi:VWFA-related protein